MVTSETVVVETVDEVFAFSHVHDTVGFLSGKGFLKKMTLFFKNLFFNF